MPNAIYNSFKRDIMNGSIDLDTDTIKMMLVTSSYTPNIDTHSKRSDITNEVVGVGYTSGGVTLANKVVSVNNTTDRGIFTCDPISILATTITARGCVIYKSRGGLSSADEIIAYGDFGEDITSTGGTFNISAPILNLL